MNAAARVVSDAHKFDRGLTNIRRNDLHWLDVPERVTFRLCVMVYKCLYDMAPVWTVPADLQHRRTLSTAFRDSQRPGCSKMLTIGRRAFSCVGPAAWNSLPDRLKNCTLTIEQFRRLLKSSAWSAWEIFIIMRCINPHLYLHYIYTSDPLAYTDPVVSCVTC